MLKSKLKEILLLVGSVLIVIGIAVMAWVLITDGDRSAIEVQISDGKTETVEFEALGLVPGERCEYNITMRAESSDIYDLTLDFVETGESTLKNFARVKIVANGDILCDELLATVFENDAILMSVDFRENRNTDLKIIYYLPAEVGNEAKNTEAEFELLITASNE